MVITAASAAYLNQALEPTAYSFGSAPLHLRFRRRLTASVRLRCCTFAGSLLSLKINLRG